MKIFLSWSGQRSREVAELLDEWLRCVIQSAKPWVSSRDIDRGALWFTEIGEQLSETSIGIVCLTQDNKDKPWILFETGALAKGLSHNRVCTLLIDLTPADIVDPLAQFNHTFPTEESMLSLVHTLNKAMKDGALDEKVLLTVFKTYWPQFREKFEKIVAKETTVEVKKKRPNESILEEILENTRTLGNKVRQLEARIEIIPNENMSSNKNAANTIARFLAKENEKMSKMVSSAKAAAEGINFDQFENFDPNGP